jgi:hypothetical protein
MDARINTNSESSATDKRYSIVKARGTFHSGACVARIWTRGLTAIPALARRIPHQDVGYSLAGGG